MDGLLLVISLKRQEGPPDVVLPASDFAFGSLLLGIDVAPESIKAPIQALASVVAVDRDEIVLRPVTTPLAIPGENHQVAFVAVSRRPDQREEAIVVTFWSTLEGCKWPGEVEAESLSLALEVVETS